MGPIARRVGFLLVCLSTAILAAYFGQPLAHNNPDVVLILVTVMTVFAGFLVAIIAVLGDPEMISGGSWRTAEGERGAVYANVVTHKWLFRLYLLAIALLFAGVLMEKLPSCGRAELFRVWIERAYLFFGVFAFSLTVGLPGTLARLQIARVDAEVERRRRDAGLKD